MGKFEVSFLGTNGSCAYNSGRREKYGSNTLCTAVRAGDTVLIFDSGSGISGFGRLEDYQREELHLFYSHYHIDHLSGLLFFSELFNKEKTIHIYGSPYDKQDLKSLINDFLSNPLHPVGLKEFNAKLNFHELTGGDILHITQDVTVSAYQLSHPGGSIGYRVDYDGKSFCYCTDIELANHENDEGFLEFIRETDLLVFDAFFEEDKKIAGWGHSSWKECAQWAKRAGALKLALFHYNYMAEDKDIDLIEQKAQEIFAQTFASADRMRITL